MSPQPSSNTAQNPDQVRDIDELIQVFDRLKQAIEKHKAEDLVTLLETANIWLENRPVTAQAFSEEVMSYIQNSGDTEFGLSDIKEFDFDKSSASLSAQGLLTLSDEETWTEHEIHFQIHMGVVEQKGSWNIAYLGMMSTRAPDTLNLKADVDLPKPSTIPEPMAAGTDFFSKAHVHADYFEPGYFSHHHPSPHPQTNTQSNGEPGLNDMVAVQVPMFLPYHVVKSMVKS